MGLHGKPDIMFGQSVRLHLTGSLFSGSPNLCVRQRPKKETRPAFSGKVCQDPTEGVYSLVSPKSRIKTFYRPGYPQALPGRLRCGCRSQPGPWSTTGGICQPGSMDIQILAYRRCHRHRNDDEYLADL